MNSHVHPKFLGINMFGPKEKRVAIQTRKNSNPQKRADLPKEDNLLCKSCEKKISSIESITAPKLKKDNQEEFNRNFRVNDIGYGIEPINLDSKHLLLLFYSVFVRIHYSRSEGFEQIKIDNASLEKMKQTLNSILSEKSSEVEENITSKDFNFLPFVVFTSGYDNDLN